jgi:hypothetical protein
MSTQSIGYARHSGSHSVKVFGSWEGPFKIDDHDSRARHIHVYTTFYNPPSTLLVLTVVSRNMASAMLTPK